MSNATWQDPRTRCDRTPAWAALAAHYAAQGQAFDLRQAFASDPQRTAQFSQGAPLLWADLSKNLIAPHTQALLLQLAEQCGLAAYRDAMFAGAPINHTEQRAVMHWLLRHPQKNEPNQAQTLTSQGLNAPEIQAYQAHLAPALNGPLAQALAAVHDTLEAMLALAEAVRSDAGITDIVHIGIGGSGLGPAMVVQALQAQAHPGKRLHFISNVDGLELGSVLHQLRPDSTLFLIASKTFTTLETMTNAQAARAWFVAQGGSADPAAALSIDRHFVGLTSNRDAAQAFGITQVLGFWDWVGGRYSLWSAIGLPIAIAIGAAGFRALLAGAHAMDAHFQQAPLAANLPVRLGLLDLWYRNFYGFDSRSIAPYSHGLRHLPAYLQQLEMESNGKGVDWQGRRLPYASAPAIWGEAGTNGQHAYFQLLHQGSQPVPVEFIAFAEPGPDLPEQHPRLLANALAQARALMLGSSAQAEASPAPTTLAALEADNAVLGHSHFDGNRPSSFLLLPRLDAASLGALIALYEHRVFVSGALWGINSFDQWGVELGKRLARDLEPRLSSGDTSGLDASTAALVQRLKQHLPQHLRQR